MHPKVTVFKFTSYKFEPLKKRVILNYKTEFLGKKSLLFTETVILPEIPNINQIPRELLKKLLESLHIMLGISYYKLYPVKYREAVISPKAKLFNRVNCATKVKLPYKLSKKEADFWNTVYKKGLGEFFYKNNLDPKISPKFPFDKNVKTTNYSLQTTNSRCLVGIGGGKDSIVVSELLKENNFNFSTFFVETNKTSNLVSKIAKLIDKKCLVVRRTLDPKVFEQHQFAGHIPISAVYAFLGLLSCALYNYKYFVVANEYSSNFGNLKYKGLMINHQWSKSFEFEKLLQDYVSNFITKDIFYFSLLRPFYEIRIAKMFASYKRYFPYFSSCNTNFKINQSNLNRKLWCCQCAKCVFSFTILSALLSKKELFKIFGRNLYQDKSLLSLFKDILGFGKMKPFDCVGTFEEAQSALFIAKNKFKRDFIVRQLGSRAKHHREVFKTQKESNIPEQFKFLGMENTFILRYGAEGKITEQYLKKYYPKLKIGIGHEALDKNYLKKQKQYDIAIKTPGINKTLIEIPYTTPTNIFFSKVLGKNLIIGITGSKGKSTTSSLIYHILKTSGKNVELLGNIGKPMLATLLKPLPKNRIFVLELSSFQLDDIKFSPDIAVVTNLFPEHMDYHGSIDEYYQAKKNIINFQGKNDYFIYNPKNKLIKKWLNSYKGKAILFTNNIPLKNKAIPLLGEHNENNIKAAITVAKVLDIKDKIIKEAIKSFKGLPHRLEFVGESKGIKFYNDASSTNPESAILAIETIKDIDTILLGGENRGYNFSQLEKTIKKYKIRNIVLFPDSGEKIIKHKKGFNILKTSSMQKAVEFSYKNTKKGNVCLLSGASPSYSLWENFEEKGNQFKKFVKKLSK